MSEQIPINELARIVSAGVERLQDRVKHLEAQLVGKMSNQCGFVSGSYTPTEAPPIVFGQAVTDGQIVAIYAGTEDDYFKLLRRNQFGQLFEVRRPLQIRCIFRPATYDEMRAACPHDWLVSRYCDYCRPRTPETTGDVP